MNQTLMQYFEWYLPADHQHWNTLKSSVHELANLGITSIWLPPAFKGTGPTDVGYGVYDLFDLGEFDQKGSLATKYGTKDEYLAAIQALKEVGIAAIADIVLNHKAGGDYKERFFVQKMSADDRQKAITEPYEIEGWTGFDFPGRQETYNDFKWHWYHFTGLDFDASNGESGIYQICGDNKGWSDRVDDENGNYDYLMFNDIDFKHPEVLNHLKDWVKWFIETTGVSGFRLDAVKHIDEAFMAEFIHYIRQELDPQFMVFGEFWKNDAQATENYLQETGNQYGLVDVVLHMNFFEASQAGDSYDLRQIFNQSLVLNQAQAAITFVDNHDTQRGQALESTVEDWFKPLAYALILLRQDGLPCLFYGDYYGIKGKYGQRDFKDILDTFMWLRRDHCYGQQVDYFDRPNAIGWTQLGDDQHPDGFAVIMSNADETSIPMSMGPLNAGKTLVDALGNHPGQVIIDQEGWAEFPVNAGSLSVWINQDSFL